MEKSFKLNVNFKLGVKEIKILFKDNIISDFLVISENGSACIIECKKQMESNGVEIYFNK